MKSRREKVAEEALVSRDKRYRAVSQRARPDGRPNRRRPAGCLAADETVGRSANRGLVIGLAVKWRRGRALLGHGPAEEGDGGALEQVPVAEGVGKWHRWRPRRGRAGK